MHGIRERGHTNKVNGQQRVAVLHLVAVQALVSTDTRVIKHREREPRHPAHVHVVGGETSGLTDRVIVLVGELDVRYIDACPSQSAAR